MAVEFKRLFEVLEEVRGRHPGILLWEVEPMARFVVDDAPRHIGIWNIDTLLATVERDFRNMTRAEREEFERHLYFWGYLPDRRVSIAVRPPGDSTVFTQFVQAR
jgi:hypothetical protein